MSETTPHPDPAAAPAPSQPTPAANKGPSVRQLLIVVGILTVTVILTALTSDVNQALEPGIAMRDGKPFLPATVGAWQGGETQGLTKEEREALPVDTEGVRRVYRQNGMEIVCAIVLAGRDVTSIHRPEVCLPGQGWSIENARKDMIRTPAAPGGAVEVMRLDTKRLVQTTAQRNSIVRSIFVYWFVGKDITTADHWKRILWTARDRVFHNRNHRWAYILVYAPVGVESEQPLSPELAQRSMAMVSGFVQEVYPALKGP